MNYELAKELKDNGYEQKLYPGAVYRGDGFVQSQGENTALPPTTDAVYVPTLEELIEACGDKLHFITRVHDDMWEAGARDSFYDAGSGKTPTEAVARLWLALNEKSE